MNIRAIFFLFVLFPALFLNSAISQNIFNFKHDFSFESKLKKKKRVQVRSWTDKKTYKLSDTIRLVIESNKLFEKSPLTKLIMPNLKKGRSRTSTEIKNGKINSYYLREYLPVKTGSIKIPSIETTIKNKSYKTRRIKIVIIQD